MCYDTSIPVCRKGDEWFPCVGGASSLVLIGKMQPLCQHSSPRVEGQCLVLLLVPRHLAFHQTQCSGEVRNLAENLHSHISHRGHVSPVGMWACEISFVHYIRRPIHSAGRSNAENNSAKTGIHEEIVTCLKQKPGVVIATSSVTVAFCGDLKCVCSCLVYMILILSRCHNKLARSHSQTMAALVTGD